MSDTKIFSKEDKEKLNSEAFREYCDFRKFDEVEVMFGLSSPGGGTHGEMCIHWEELSGELVPQLKCYNDGFGVLSTFHDVLDKLAEWDDYNFTPDEFVELLESLGFISSDSYTGDYLPEKTFEEYQKKRLQKKNRLENLDILLDAEK